MDFNKAVIVIGGGSKGIGLSIAKHLLNLGSIVITCSRTRPKLGQISKAKDHIVPFIVDLSNEADTKKAIADIVDKYGYISAVVCNAGNGRSVPPGNESFDEWQRIFAANLWTTTNLVEASVPFLQKTMGSIVCISSICGEEVVPNAPVTYSAAKSALNSYVRGIARPLGKKNIRINGISLGNMFFEGSTWEQKLKDNPSAVNSLLNDEVSIQKFGHPQDVSNLVEYLLSDLSCYASGSIWRLDGGQARS